MRTIFVSYRRDDSFASARLLKEQLGRWLPDTDVFLDESGIEAGAEWSATLKMKLDAAQVVLVVIGGRWTTMEGRSGARRLEDPDDVVRRDLQPGPEYRGWRIHRIHQRPRGGCRRHHVPGQDRCEGSGYDRDRRRGNRTSQPVEGRGVDHGARPPRSAAHSDDAHPLFAHGDRRSGDRPVGQRQRSAAGSPHRHQATGHPVTGHTATGHTATGHPTTAQAATGHPVGRTREVRHRVAAVPTGVGKGGRRPEDGSHGAVKHSAARRHPPTSAPALRGAAQGEAAPAHIRSRPVPAGPERTVGVRSRVDVRAWPCRRMGSGPRRAVPQRPARTGGRGLCSHELRVGTSVRRIPWTFQLRLAEDTVEDESWRSGA